MERKLVQVERGNVILRVPEDDVQRYYDQGFNLLDDNGNVIKKSLPNDVGTLQKAFINHTKKIEELESEIAKLKAKKRSSKKKTD